LKDLTIIIAGAAFGFACAVAPVVVAEPTVPVPSCSTGQRIWDIEVLNVVDGDTYDFRVDLGLDVSREERIRLIGLDTPEVRGDDKERGFAATDAAIEFFESCPCTIESEGDRGKYGRLLADVRNKDGVLISEFLRVRGHVK
jgi:micrococcal nuclease